MSYPPQGSKKGDTGAKGDKGDKGDTGLPGTTVHSALTNLAYADAAHTGFEPTVTKGNLTGTSPVTLDQTRSVIGGAAVISLVNNAGTPATITAFDTGALANTDTVIPTAKAVTTALSAKQNTLTTGNLTATAPCALDQTRTVIGGAAVVSLVNDAAAAVTEIDTGALQNVDTVVPTSKAVTTAIAGKVVVAGQIGGTAASPTVIGITSTDPATLTIGAITDGQYLKRSGTTLISGVPAAVLPEFVPSIRVPTVDATIAANYDAMHMRPFTIPAAIKVTVAPAGRLVIL
jgi:hypothetical protein